jgi:leucyl aminopeptidase
MRTAPRRSALSLFVAASLAAVAMPLCAAPRTLAFEPYAVPGTGSIAIAVREGVPLEGALAQADTASGGAIARAIAAAQFKGKRDTRLDLPGVGNYDRVLLVGIGKDPVTPRLLEDVGGTVAQALAKAPDARVELLWPGEERDAAAHLAFGASLGQYRFDKYKSRNSGEDQNEANAGATLVVRTPAGAASEQAWNAQWKPVADAVAFSRDLVTEPANALWPEEFVARTRQAFDGLPVRIEVLDEAAMKRLGMGGILAVGQGSARPPRLLAVHYDGGRSAQAPVAFVGKGITFDTGGISIKDSDGLWRMKYDMSGAASVTGAVLALAGRRAPVNAVAIAALAENMPSGTASRPGDVVTTMSGKTFEIISTDAEGRMVLSDAVWYAQQKYGATTVIDIATLTGAIVTALGDEYAGMFSRDDALAAQLQQAGEASGEELWRMPLHPSYAKDLESPIADLRNGGARTAGAGAGAHFIGEWIRPGTRWAHLDIAGMAWRETAGTPTSPTGASAFGVRLLDRYARDHLETRGD